MSERQRNHRGKAIPMIDPEVFRPERMAAELRRLEAIPARAEPTVCPACGRLIYVASHVERCPESKLKGGLD